MEESPAQIDLSLLAAEYVLGTLAGEDRKRFELAMAVNPALKRFVLRWTDLFGKLSPSGHAEPASGQLWDRIANEIDREEEVVRRLRQHDETVQNTIVTAIAALRVIRDRLNAVRKRALANDR